MSHEICNDVELLMKTTFNFCFNFPSIQLIQGIGVGILTKRFKDTTLLNWSVLIIAIAYLLMVSTICLIRFCVSQLLQSQACKEIMTTFANVRGRH